MLRALVLSLVLLIGLGAVIPLATDYAEAGTKKTRKYKKKRKNKVKKYSKRWWRIYRAKQKRKKALAARKRALRLRAARKKWQKLGDKRTVAKAKPKVGNSKSAVLPSGKTAPKGWKPGNATNGELQFTVEGGNGSEIGKASITVVGPANGEDNGRSKTIGGVPVASLRRTVIDRMIQENGWVVNDFQKEVGGKRVYVVVAQSQVAANQVQSRMFYFTEVDGRIYSVSTSAPSNSSERLAEESEKVINSLQRSGRTIQAGIR
jgi:hypothetical protein